MHLSMTARLLLATVFLLSVGCGDDAAVLQPDDGADQTHTGKADDGASSAATCSYDNVWLVADSNALEDLSGGGGEVRFDDAAALDEVTRAQLLAAAVHLRAVDSGASLEDAFDNVDDNAMYTHGFSIHGAAFDWVQLYLGDTEVGVVFDAGTARIVAEIGDGDISGCSNLPVDAPACEEATLTCDWSPAWLASSSSELRDVATDSQVIEAGTELDELSAAQLIAAATHLQGIEPGAGLAAAIASGDEASWRVSTVTFGEVAFTWFKAYMGDTEVGVVFDRGTVQIVAEVGDGDILGCTRECPPSTPPGDDDVALPEPAVCSYEHPWLAESSAPLWDAATDATELDSHSKLDSLAEAQVLAAAVHLQGIDAGDSLEMAFASTDESSWNRSTLVLEGQTFEWVQSWMGDTEVGVVFAAGTLEIVAEIGDGDVLGCVAPSGAHP